VILGGKRLDPATAAKLGREMIRAQALIAQAAKCVNAAEPWRTSRAKSLDRRSLVSGVKSIQMSDLCRLTLLEQLQADNGVEACHQRWLGNLAMLKKFELGEAGARYGDRWQGRDRNAQTRKTSYRDGCCIGRTACNMERDNLRSSVAQDIPGAIWEKCEVPPECSE
jgi:hypothetical protein